MSASDLRNDNARGCEVPGVQRPKRVLANESERPLFNTLVGRSEHGNVPADAEVRIKEGKKRFGIASSGARRPNQRPGHLNASKRSRNRHDIGVVEQR